jgi:small-conductance mechanosensitive channel/CRP-like cAMP-binding protein
MSNETSLIAASVLLLATFVVPRLISRWSLLARASWRVGALIGLTILVRALLGSPVAPHYGAADAGLRLWEQIVEIGWWIVAAQGAIGLTRLLIVFETKPRETRIISDLLAGLIYLVTLLAIVNFVFQVPIGGLLATSGVIAIVLGLALQNSLADVFSGIAMRIERPYSVGDLLWVEGGIEGNVIQVNWRSTHIATMNKDVAIVPNSVMAKARLINHSMPTTARGRSITVKLDVNEPPARCMAVLTAAAKTCMLLMDEPSPSVARTELNGDGATYEIDFAVASSAAIMDARSELLGQVQNHLRHAGISLAVTGMAQVPRTKIPGPAELLEGSDWFGALSPEDRALLAEHLTVVFAAPGEQLIRKDEDPRAMYIIASGAVAFSDGTPAGRRIVYRMGPGGSIGAIGLVTGSPYAVTATALTPLKAYRLDKEAIRTAIELRPQLVSSLEVIASHRQDMQRGGVAAPESDRMEPSHLFLARLQDFLQKLSAAAAQEIGGGTQI